MWWKLTLVLHAALLGLVLARPQLWGWALAGVLLNHAVLVLSGLLPRSGWLGDNLNRLPREKAHYRRVALSFDDGPDPRVTPRVLEILARWDVKASFFCVGERARRHPELVRAIAAAGHCIENHSQHHPWYFAFLGPRAMAREISTAQALLTNLTGTPPRYFRPPAGIRNPWLNDVLSAQGLQLVSWTRRGFDTVTRDPQRVLARLTRHLPAGAILVLHDTAQGSRGTVVLEVLPRLLEHLAREGRPAGAIPPVENADTKAAGA